MSALTEIRQSEFESKVLQSRRPVLVDFYATWCGPCKALAPTVDAVASEVGGSADVYKVNVDEEPELASQFGVMSIPTLVYFRNGDEVTRQNGIQSKDRIISTLGEIGRG